MAISQLDRAHSLTLFLVCNSHYQSPCSGHQGDGEGEAEVEGQSTAPADRRSHFCKTQSFLGEK